MDKTLSNYMTCQEAAKELGRSHQTILNWIHNGRFANIVTDSTWTKCPAFYISKEEIREVKNSIDAGEKRFHRKIVRTVIKEVPVQEKIDLTEVKKRMDKLADGLSQLYQLAKQLQIDYIDLFARIEELDG